MDTECGLEDMNDLQSKFALTLVAFGLFFAYAVPKAKQASHDRDAVLQHAAEVYVSPNPNDPRSPSGWVSVDDLEKYAELKAAERHALAMR